VVPGFSQPGLPKYALVDFTASRAMGRNLEVFFGVQNLFNREYFVGTLPTTIGSPRLVNGGFRLRFIGR
jgi:outer membrane receptor protein involved in Fe transport